MVWSAIKKKLAESEWSDVRDELIRGIEFGVGYQLIFFFTPSIVAAAHVRNSLVSYFLAEKRTRLHCYVLKDPDELLDLRTNLVRKSHVPTAGCVWIQSLEWDPPGVEWGPWQNAWGELFARLNSQRGVLESEFKIPLIFVGPPNAKPVIRQAAPDLWSKKSNTVECGGETTQVTAIESPIAEETSILPRFSEIERELERQNASLSRSETLIDMAEARYLSGDYIASHDAAFRALEGLPNEGQEMQRSRAYAALAHAEEMLGRIEAAAEHIRHAIDLRANINRNWIPRTWFITAGKIAYKQKDPDRALQLYAQALDLIQLEKTKPVQHEASILAEARLRMRMAEAYEIKDQHEQADENALDALRSVRSLVDADPSNADAAANLFFISLDFGSLVGTRGNDVGAIAAFQDAVNVARRTVDRFQNDRVWRQRLCFALNRLGDAFAKTAQNPEARLAYEEALTLRREFLQEKPDDLASMGDLSRLLRKIATSRSNNQDPNGAYAAIAEAVRLDEERVKKTTDRELLDALREALPERYARASKMAHDLGKRDEALQWACKAVDVANELEKSSGKNDLAGKHIQWLAELEATKD